jgi:hypothetical protein
MGRSLLGQSAFFPFNLLLDSGVEFAGYYDRTAPQLRRLLDDQGLKCCGTHIQLPALAGDALASTVEFNRTLGNKYLIVSWMPPSYAESLAKVREMAKVYDELAAKLKDQGMRVGYHAHGGDFRKIDGETAWDLFFANTCRDVAVQLDLGNCLEGGGDPLATLKKFPGRFLFRCAGLVPPHLALGQGKSQVGNRAIADQRVQQPQQPQARHTFQFRDARIGDNRVVEKHDLEIRQPGQLPQPGIADLSAGEIQGSQLAQPGQAIQSGVGHRRVAEHKTLESGQLSDLRQTRVRHLSVAQVKSAQPGQLVQISQAAVADPRGVEKQGFETFPTSDVRHRGVADRRGLQTENAQTVLFP